MFRELLPVPDMIAVRLPAAVELRPSQEAFYDVGDAGVAAISGTGLNRLELVKLLLRKLPIPSELLS